MIGILVTGGVVVAYTMFGGFLAVSLTDFVQGCIMVVALVLMPLVILTSQVSYSEAAATLDAIDPNFLSLTAGLSFVGFISTVAWGLGYFGQPHIIVRFMALRSVKDVPAARRIGMSWMALALLGAIGVGVLGRAYVEQSGMALEDSENDLHPARQCFVPPAHHRLSARRIAGGDHEHDQLAIARGEQLTHRGFLPALPAKNGKRARDGDGRAALRAGGSGSRRDHRC